MGFLCLCYLVSKVATRFLRITTFLASIILKYKRFAKFCGIIGA